MDSVSDSNKLKILCISDTHTKHKKIRFPVGYQDADIMLHAGDFSTIGRLHEVIDFMKWYERVPVKHKIFISGNHDFYDYQNPGHFQELLAEHAPSCIYLRDEGVTIEGIKIWGRPWTPTFGRWAFLKDRESPAMRSTLAVIPTDTDILLTHGPAAGILDKCTHGERVGCADLLNELDRLKLKYLVVGHIHEENGILTDERGITHVNAAFLDERYQEKNLPHLITIDKPSK